MNDFDKLLSELTAAQADNDTLAKSLTQQGGEGGEDGNKVDAGGGAAGGDADGGTKAAGGGEDGSLTKSFKVTLADGTEVDAVDGAAALEALEKRINDGEGTMQKAMGGLLTLVKSQGTLIKSLVDEVKALREQGRGRRAVLSVVEKAPPAGTLAKSSAADETLGIQEFLAKSEAAWSAGKITGQEFSTIDVACRMGTEVDPSLVKKVLNGAAAKA